MTAIQLLNSVVTYSASSWNGYINIKRILEETRKKNDRVAQTKTMTIYKHENFYSQA